VDAINIQNKDLLYAICKFNKVTSQISIDSDMRINEVMVLAIIDGQCVESEKPLLASAVGESLCITHSAVSQIFTSLEKKGYVCRNINESDKRQYRFTLTEQGRQVTNKLKKEVDLLISRIVSRFGDDKTTELTQMLNDFAGLLVQMRSESENI